MRHFRTTVVALGLIAVPISCVAASDEEDILTALQRHFDALKAQDIEAHLQHHLSDKSTFPSDGSPLRAFASMDEQRSFYENLDDLAAR